MSTNGSPHPCAQEQLDQIRKRLSEEQAHDRYHYGDEMVLSQLVRILDHKRSLVAGAVARSREFQQDVLTFLKAFALMLDTVGGAATHGEKAARLRGLIELVESAATKLRERQFREQDTWSYSFSDDLFRSDYPVRYWINKAREAEQRAEAAEREAKEVRELWAPKPSVPIPAGPTAAPDF